jgi:hypothetical protein
MPRPPSVLLRAPEAEPVRLHPGGIVGRLTGAALRLDDPRVSEAHALLSLRGRALKLLALRGALGLRGKWLGEVELREGQRILLAEGLALEVLEVVLPATVLALEAPDGARVELDRPELSLSINPLQAQPGAQPDAAAWVWCSGEQWWLQARGERPVELSEGATLTLDGQDLQVTALPLPALETPATASAGKLHPPLTIRCWPQHTEIAVEGRAHPVKLTRNAHSILRETALLTQGGGSAHWLEVAERIWRVNATEDNWYTNLARLRERLRQHDLPQDLVRCSDGQVQLALREGADRVEISD